MNRWDAMIWYIRERFKEEPAAKYQVVKNELELLIGDHIFIQEFYSLWNQARNNA